MTSLQIYDGKKIQDKDYGYSDMIFWPSEKIETEEDYFNLLFPSKLTDKEIKKIKSDETTKIKIIVATIRYMVHLGLIINQKFEINIRPSKYIYNSETKDRITLILNFLVSVDLRVLAFLFFCSLGFLLKNDKKFSEKIDDGQLRKWQITQKPSEKVDELLKVTIENFDSVVAELKKNLNSPTSSAKSSDKSSPVSSPKSSPKSSGKSSPLSSPKSPSSISLDEEDEEEEEENEEEDEEEIDFPFKGLKWERNSCYMDSVMIALLLRQNSFILNNIVLKDISSIKRNEFVCDKGKDEDHKIRTELQEEIGKMTYYINNPDSKEKTVGSCSKFRKILSKCTEKGKAFASSQMQDPQEFLEFLFKIFDVNTLEMVRTIIKTEDFKSDIDDVSVKERVVSKLTTFPIVTVRFWNKNSDIELSKDILEDDAYIESKNLRYITKTELKGNYVIFYVPRLNENHRVIYGNVDFEKNINLNVDRNLHLFAIVVYRSSHYTSYVKWNKQWYYYNDIPNTFVLVGDFEALKSVKKSPNPVKNGTLFFYSTRE